MKKNLTELVFILDRSGSMSGLESDTIGGFNSMLEKQKSEAGEALVTTVLFDDRYEMIHDRFRMELVKPLTRKEYYARGCTALLDAMGRTIEKLISVQKYLPEEEQAEKMIFVIITDGMENSSREYSYRKIREMVRQQKEKFGWEFIFLGANMDAVAEAERFGIEEDRAVTFANDRRGVRLNYRVMTETISEMRACAPSARVGGKWKKEIEEDMECRHK